MKFYEVRTMTESKGNEPNNNQPKNKWIKEALAKRGHKQRDLARNWAVAEGSVTRFISGEENQNLALSKAITLSRMLGITIDDLAKGLGLDGKFIEPAVEATTSAKSLSPGAMNVEVVGGGKIRVTMCQDLSPEAVAQVLAAVSQDKK